MSGVAGKPQVVAMERDRTNDESERSEPSHDLVAAATSRANRKKRILKRRQKRVSLGLLPYASASPMSLSHSPTQPHPAPHALEIDATKLRFLFQKELQESDVGTLKRIVLPKRAAEAFLPPNDAKKGIPIIMDDMNGQRVWNFKYRFWANNNSKMYVLEKTGEFVRTHNLQVGDYVMLFKDVENGKYVIQARKYFDHNHMISNHSMNDLFQQASVPTMDDLGIFSLGDTTTFFDDIPITFPGELEPDYATLESMTNFGSLNFDDFL
ncbi:hypothetical protein NE237_023154 [Protea cynaroides]|uniref:TF-B3 domain-containing protein n=1 Tax=Protea cynaroides TaxID=273540 RepID=A0A9Q0K5X6_9MAGN|nr:hypothetical protein NE237_023154 [Protea cynaroides]